MDPDAHFLEALKASQNTSAPHAPSTSRASSGALEENGDYVIKALPSAEVRIPGRGAIDANGSEEEAVPSSPPAFPARPSRPSSSGAAPAMQPLAQQVAPQPVIQSTIKPEPSVATPAARAPAAASAAQPVAPAQPAQTPSSGRPAERPIPAVPAQASDAAGVAQCAITESQDGIAMVWDVFLPHGSGVVVKLMPRRATFFMGSERVLAPHVTWRSADAIATEDVRAFARTLLSAADTADRLPQVTVAADVKDS